MRFFRKFVFVFVFLRRKNIINQKVSPFFGGEKRVCFVSPNNTGEGPFNKEGDSHHFIRMWEWNLYLWVNGNAFCVGSALGSEFCVTSGIARSSSVPLMLSGVKGDWISPPADSFSETNNTLKLQTDLPRKVMYIKALTFVLKRYTDFS